MKKQEKIAAIMTKDVVVCDINESLHKASDMFAKNKIRHIPIVSKKNLVGIMSKTDILRISFGNAFGEDQKDTDSAIFDMLSINQVMKHSPVTVSPDQHIRDAAHIFTENEFHALPVTLNNKLVGIITTTDVIKHFLES